MADEPLLLGIPDEKMGQNDDRICGWSTNKIGGAPNWMFGEPSDFPRCPVCATHLLLVSQVYCPLAGSPYHRVLYVFGCIRPACWNVSQSWKVLRCQAKDTSAVYEEPSTGKTSCQFEVDDWCNDAGDWGDEEFTNDPLMSELEQHAGKMSVLESAEASKPEESTQSPTLELESHSSNSISTVPHFIPYYVTVLDEPSKALAASKTLKHEQRLLAQYQQREGVKLDEVMESGDDGKNSWSGETYEKPSLKHGDKAFHKFYKTVQLCPEQVLRYQRDGVPLSLTTTTPSEFQTRVPPCPFCGSQRVFEMQLMPALVNILRMGVGTVDVSITHTKGNSQEHEMKYAISVQDDLQLKQSSCERQPCSSEQCFPESSDCIADEKELMEEYTSSSDMTIEFGAVLVYTCSRSCWLDSMDRDSFREEYVIVEADPDAKLFTNSSRSHIKLLGTCGAIEN